MAEKKKTGRIEIIIIAIVLIVFAAIVIAYAGQWDYVEDEASDGIASFQYITSSKSDDDDESSFEGNTGEIKLHSVNINTATKEQLDSLPGIGTKKAEAIIEYRNNVSTFLKPEDIKNVSGIGDKVYEQIKDYIAVK